MIVLTQKAKPTAAMQNAAIAMTQQTSTGMDVSHSGT